MLCFADYILISVRLPLTSDDDQQSPDILLLEGNDPSLKPEQASAEPTAVV